MEQHARIRANKENLLGGAETCQNDASKRAFAVLGESLQSRDCFKDAIRLQLSHQTGFQEDFEPYSRDTFRLLA